MQRETAIPNSRDRASIQQPTEPAAAQSLVPAQSERLGGRCWRMIFLRHLGCLLPIGPRGPFCEDYHSSLAPPISHTLSMNPAPTSVDQRLAAWLLRRTPGSGVRRVAALSAAVASDVGLQRDQNQDRVALSRGQDRLGRPYAALALTDGIGGMRDGGRCAALALGSFLASVEDDARSGLGSEAWLARGAARANANVHAEFRGAGGSTLVAALLVAGRAAQWLSVGDSRVHLWLGSTLHQLSVDDTIAGQLGKAPDAGLDSSNLLQFIGVGEQLEPHVESVVATDGSIILTSDGVHFIDTKFLAPIVAHAQDAGVCARRLIDVAKWHGGPDNASVALISLDTKIEIPIESGDIGLEVWDPFGELLIMPAHTQRAPEKTTLPRVDATAPTVAPATAPEPASALPDERAAVSNQNAATKSSKEKRGRPGKKQKPAVRKDADPEAVESKGATPQLLIEFPGKGS